jgi:hypothetical protein
MTFAQMLATDLDAVIFNTNEFAQLVTYNSASIRAVVTYGEDLTVIRTGGRTRTSDAVAAECTITVRVADVASPAYRDTVVIAGVTYMVERIIAGDGAVWTVALTTDARPRLR